MPKGRRMPVRVPVGNTTLFIEATPRGLVDAEDPLEFLYHSPADFMPALKNANENSAKEGTRFMAVRAPVPQSLNRAPQSVQREAATGLIFEAFKIGRVERIAGSLNLDADQFIYMIMPVCGMTKEMFAKDLHIHVPTNQLSNATRLLDSKTAVKKESGHIPFLDATSKGFVRVEDEREFIEGAPTGFMEYLQKQEKSGGGGVACRITCDPRLSTSQMRKAALDEAWKAYQKSGGFLPKEAHKTDQKDKRAAGDCTGKPDSPEEKSNETVGVATGPEQTGNKKNAGDEGADGITGSHDSKTAVKPIVRRKKHAVVEGTPLPMLRQGVANLQL